MDSAHTKTGQGTGGANPGNLKQEWKYKVQRSGENVIYPYLVVNIGSGVSILKVEGPGKYDRISGSSLGGGTYWGLCRLLTRCKTFDEVLDLAEIGDANLVDMTVGDIYGRSYDKLNLSSTVVASSFGKLAMKQDPADGVREEDMARALLMMITGNIGQVAYLNAVLYKATHIYFVGNFLRHNKISCRRLAYAIDYWSGGKMEALFLEHEGYFGALGAFLNSSYVEEQLHHHAAESAAATAASPTSTGGSGSGQGRGPSSSSSRPSLQKHVTYALGDDAMGPKRPASQRLEKSYAGVDTDEDDVLRASPSPTPLPPHLMPAPSSTGAGGGSSGAPPSGGAKFQRTPPPPVVTEPVKS